MGPEEEEEDEVSLLLLVAGLLVLRSLLNGRATRQSQLRPAKRCGSPSILKPAVDLD